MAARRKNKSREVDGFDAIRAAQKAAAHRKKKPPTSETSTPGEDTAPEKAKGHAQSKSGARFQRTAMPSRHEIVCHACGSSVEVVGKSAQTVCTKCRTRLPIKDLILEASWDEELITSGTVHVKPGGEISGGSMICNNLILEGAVTGGTIRVTRRLTLKVDPGEGLCHIDCRDLEIPKGLVLDLPDEATAFHHLDLAGELTAHLRLSGGLVIRATGCLDGSVEAPRLVVEEGGGLRAGVKVVPPLEDTTKN